MAWPTKNETAAYSSGQTYIYALIDPTNGLVRYIGKTDNPKVRLYKHMRDNTSTHKTCWLKSIAPLQPEMRVLESVSKDMWKDREIHWIMLGIRHEWPLTNLLIGGPGGFNHSEESKNKMSVSRKGKGLGPRPAAVRAKISAAQRGRTVPFERRIRIALTLIGRKQSPEAIAKSAASRRGKKRGPYKRRAAA